MKKGGEKMRNLLITLLMLAAFVLVPSTVFAETTSTQPAATSTTAMTPAPMDLRHAYTPVPVNQNSWMRARVNNTTGNSQNKLVCVEGWSSANTKTHLGCLTIPWDQTSNWSQEFDAPLWMLGSGSYRIQYTYQRSDGTWQNVTDMNGSNVTPTVTR